MSAILYLYKTAFKNRVKKAVRKPITYLFAVGIIFYVVMIFGWGRQIRNMNLGEPNVLFFMMASAFTIFAVTANMLTYAKKKGLLYKQSDVHFLFQTPVSPKKILIYAQLHALFTGVTLNILMMLFGIFSMKVSPWRIIIYAIIFFVLENVLETAMMILLYGNETLSNKMIQMVCNGIKLIVAVFVLYAGYLILQEGLSVHVLETVFRNPVIQCIPVMGWVVAFLELIFLSATTVNIVCSILYVMTMILFVWLAVRMKCSGEYLEDAMKFADDYTEAKKKSAKGEVSLVGKKTKYGRAEVQYKGSGAKALYYRQLLEYKKSKWFIFGGTTLVHLAFGVAAAVFLWKTGKNIESKAQYILCGLSAYVILLLSGFVTKWQREVTSPYTFLIPDTNMRKLWYSSVIEHMRAFTNGVLLILPGAIIGHVPVLNTVLIIIAFVCLSANKTYAGIVCEELVGNVLGQGAKQTLRMIFVMTTLGISGLGAVLGAAIEGPEMAFMMFIGFTVLLTFALALLASVMFDKMEGNE